MDAGERIAFNYLTEAGFKNIVHHPDGEQHPPNFSVESKIAVEVIRLNIHHEHEDQRPYAHEEKLVPVFQGIESLLSQFGPSRDGESWYIFFTLIHPVKPWKKLKPEVEKLLCEFSTSKNRRKSSFRILDSLEIDFNRAGIHHRDFFRMGGGSEDELGYLFVSEVYRNLKIIMAKKHRLMRHQKELYDEWWLLLPDLIGFGISEDDQIQLTNLPKITSEFAKIVLISPLPPYMGVQL